MVLGVLNNTEWKMDLKWNAEKDEMETACSRHWNETGNGIREYGLEQDMEWKIEWDGN